MSELLTSLRTKKNELDLKVSALTLDITTNNTNCSNKMKEILSSKFSRVKEVLINRDSITIQIRSDDDRYNHDVTVSNQNSLYSNTFAYSPKVQWSSGSITRTAITFISYINVIAFISAEIMKSDSEFSSLMENAWSGVYNKNNELITAKNELHRTIRNIEAEVERIKKEEFFKTLKAGNFYYKLRSSYGRSIVYDVIQVAKINPKTVAIMYSSSYADANILDGFDKKLLRVKRVPNFKIYGVLNEFTMFDRKDFMEMVMDNKFKIGIDYVRKNKGLATLVDIKSLCTSLKEFGITTVNVPDNDTLRYISKWRHQILEANKV